jgi:two-component system LytT family sensor kinase
MLSVRADYVLRLLHLDIESLRLCSRLKIDEIIGPGLAEILAPPFSSQLLLENAVQHRLQSSAEAGRLRLMVRQVGQLSEMSVSDDGQGVPSGEVERVFFAAGPHFHALAASLDSDGGEPR